MSSARRGFESSQARGTYQDVGIEDATELCAFQEGIQDFWSKSPILCFGTRFIKYFLQRWVLGRSELPKPETKQSLNLPLLAWRNGYVGLRRLGV